MQWGRCCPTVRGSSDCPRQVGWIQQAVSGGNLAARGGLFGKCAEEAGRRKRFPEVPETLRSWGFDVGLRAVAASSKKTQSGPWTAADNRVQCKTVSDNRVCDLVVAIHDAGWSSPVAREAHNLEVAGSNPVPATDDSGHNWSQSADVCLSASCPWVCVSRLSLVLMSALPGPCPRLGLRRQDRASGSERGSRPPTECRPLRPPVFQLLTPETTMSENPITPQGEIVLFQAEDGRTWVECRFANETCG